MLYTGMNFYLYVLHFHPPSFDFETLLYCGVGGMKKKLPSSCHNLAFFSFLASSFLSS